MDHLMPDYHYSEPPPVHPQDTSVLNVPEQSEHGVQREYFDGRLTQLQNSLSEQITDLHVNIESTLREETESVRRILARSSVDAEKLWTLLDPGHTSTLPDFLKDPVRHVHQHLETLEEEQDKSEEEKKTLEVEKNKLEVEKAKLEDNLTASHAQSAQSLRDVLELRSENRRLKAHNIQYRDIVVKSNMGNTEVPDENVRIQFVDLRDKIQRIIHRYYNGQNPGRLERYPYDREENIQFEEQKQFRKELNNLQNEALRRYLMRAKLFELLHRRLLGQRNFGVDEFEKALIDFEQELVECKTVSPTSLAEWRSRTIECGAKLDQKSPWPATKCPEIFGFMRPQLSMSKYPTATADEAYNSMLELCEKAYRLSVLMRRNGRALFEVETFEPYTNVTPSMEARLVCQHFDGPSQDITGSKVWMTIFGALTKTPDVSSDEKLIIEKSHVVCCP